MDSWWNTLTKYYGLDWIGIAFSMCSTHFLSKKSKRGFLLGMIGNVAFVGFGMLAQSAANIFANSTYFVLNVRGWRRWKKDPPTGAGRTTGIGRQEKRESK